MENFEKCIVPMLGGPCSQHVTGNTSRQNQPQSAIIKNLYNTLHSGQNFPVGLRQDARGARICEMSLSQHPQIIFLSWASYQIRKIASYVCVGNAGNVFPNNRPERKALASDPACVTARHGMCLARAVIANPRLRGKLSRNSRRMRNPQFYVSGKRPMGPALKNWIEVVVMDLPSIGFPFPFRVGSGLVKGVLWQVALIMVDAYSMFVRHLAN